MNTFIVFLLSIGITIQQYQQYYHLKGSTTFESDPVYGTTGEYNEETNIGGISYSTSVLVSNDTEILVSFGQRTTNTPYDQMWMYSILKNQWKFLKGRKDDMQRPEFVERFVFDKSYQIGSRKRTKGWKEQDDVCIYFGGDVVLKMGNSNDFYNSNDMWRYNISDNSYSVLFFPEIESDLDGQYIQLKQYNKTNVPRGRDNHEIIKINDDEALLLGGLADSRLSYSISDWWIFSTKLMQWKCMGGGVGYVSYTQQNIDYDVYGNLGSRYDMVATKINAEEVIIFGGNLRTSTTNSRMTNVLQKYNITSNLFKFIGGTQYSNNKKGSGYSRSYDSTNFPGSRMNHVLITIKENEALLFG